MPEGETIGASFFSSFFRAIELNLLVCASLSLFLSFLALSCRSFNRSRESKKTHIRACEKRGEGGSKEREPAVRKGAEKSSLLSQRHGVSLAFS